VRHADKIVLGVELIIRSTSPGNTRNKLANRMITVVGASVTNKNATQLLINKMSLGGWQLKSRRLTLPPAITSQIFNPLGFSIET
jgi:hypothetical protein